MIILRSIAGVKQKIRESEMPPNAQNAAPAAKKTHPPTSRRQHKNKKRKQKKAAQPLKWDYAA